MDSEEKAEEESGGSRSCLGGVSPHISSLHGREARRAEDGPSAAAGECRCVRGAVFCLSLASIFLYVLCFVCSVAF